MFMPVFVGVGIMFVQICTGINTIIYYTPTIFQIAGFDSHIGAIYATIGIGFVNFIMTIVAIATIDRLGRKPLLYIGLCGMLISLLALGGSFAWAEDLGDSRKWLAVAAVVIYIASFANQSFYGDFILLIYFVWFCLYCFLFADVARHHLVWNIRLGQIGRY